MQKIKENFRRINKKEAKASFYIVENLCYCYIKGVWGVAPMQAVSRLCRCVCASTAFVPLHRATALCGCHYASLHSGFVWLTASILAWSRGGSPIKIAPSHGEGVWGFGKDAEIERPKALQDAKPTKRSYRDREFAPLL